jgi:hypothetical protein
LNPGRCGVGARAGEAWEKAATWARGAGGVGARRRAGNGCGATVSATAGIAASWRRKTGPTGGPHLSVTQGEEGGAHGPDQQEEGRARAGGRGGGLSRWPKKREKEEKKREKGEKGERIFRGI